MSEDLIRRSDAINAIHDSCFLDEIEEAIYELPTIEPKRGRWIPCTKSGLILTELMLIEGQKWYGYKCSNCNDIYKGNALKECKFCRNCGADMRGKDDE